MTESKRKHGIHQSTADQWASHDTWLQGEGVKQWLKNITVLHLELCKIPEHKQQLFDATLSALYHNMTSFSQTLALQKGRRGAWSISPPQIKGELHQGDKQASAAGFLEERDWMDAEQWSLGASVVKDYIKTHDPTKQVVYECHTGREHPGLGLPCGAMSAICMMDADLVKGLAPGRSTVKHHGSLDPAGLALAQQILSSSSSPETKAASIRVCANCAKLADKTEFKQCSRCKFVRYCSVDCQKAHWKAHKADCKLVAESLKN